MNFSQIRDYIRAALQDTDANIKIYDDASLNSQIRFTIFSKEYSESPTDTLATPLSNQLTLEFILLTAIRILAGQPEDMSYRSPVMSMTRRGHKAGLMAILEEMLGQSQGGRFACESETDILAYLQSPTRFADELAAASNV